jgi:hypothetical protein
MGAGTLLIDSRCFCVCVCMYVCMARYTSHISTKHRHWHCWHCHVLVATLTSCRTLFSFVHHVFVVLEVSACEDCIKTGWWCWRWWWWWWWWWWRRTELTIHHNILMWITLLVPLLSMLRGFITGIVNICIWSFCNHETVVMVMLI